MGTRQPPPLGWRGCRALGRVPGLPGCLSPVAVTLVAYWPRSVVKVAPENLLESPKEETFPKPLPWERSLPGPGDRRWTEPAFSLSAVGWVPWPGQGPGPPQLPLFVGGHQGGGVTTVGGPGGPGGFAGVPKQETYLKPLPWGMEPARAWQ